mgnify:CR=1 FL=1
MKLKNKNIDWLLIPTFLATAATGIGLHLARHRGAIGMGQNWSMAHIAASALMLIAVVCHIYLHWGWYKSLLAKGFGKKSKLTTLLTAIFATMAVTGLILLISILGDGSHLGRWHYIIGLLLIAIAIFHISFRIKTLIKISKSQLAKH